jgi:hypothetical protein
MNSILIETEDRYSPSLAQQALAALRPRPVCRDHHRSFHARRKSMMSLGTPSFEPEEPSPFVAVSFMPAVLDDKIREIANQEWHYRFRLRRSPNGDWADRELADQILSLYFANPSVAHAETAVLVCGFLLRFSADVSDATMRQLQRCQLKGAAAFLDHYLLSVGRRSLSSVRPSDAEWECFCWLREFGSSPVIELASAPLRFLKHIIKFQELNSSVAYDILALINDGIVVLPTNASADYSDSIAQSRSANAKLWRRFWSCMTVDRAPWHESLPACAIRQVHFKRDTVICANLCPVKMRQNRSFDSHLQAVLLRDTGRPTTAQELLHKYQAEITAEYQKNAPVELLEVVEEPISQSSSEFVHAPAKYILELPCQLVRVTGVKEATFTLLMESVLITMVDRSKIHILPTQSIVNILLRTRFHRPTAIEIFTDQPLG